MWQFSKTDTVQTIHSGLAFCPVDEHNISSGCYIVAVAENAMRGSLKKILWDRFHLSL
jgi:hypothetical protein